MTVTKADRYKQERNTRLDSLLRKIRRSGIGDLSADEWGWLERVAGELRFELGHEDQNPDHEGDEGED